jgi:hypothetical protein
MKGRTGASFGDKSAPLRDRADDLYETAPEATATLLRVENLPGVVWECACGKGAIVRILRATGRTVYATDLVDYDSPDQDEARWDFLSERQLPIGVKAIVTNPPYKNAALFVRKALELCPRVVMLLRLNFLESGNEKSEAGRARIFCLDTHPPARVHVFRNRLPMQHRHGWEGAKTTNTIAFAWFVWDLAHVGPTELHRVSWKPIRPVINKIHEDA